MSNILVEDGDRNFSPGGAYNNYDDGFDGVGIRTFSKLPYSEELRKGLDVIVAGVPFDAMTEARPGMRFGPTGIRAAYIGNTCSPDLNVATTEEINAIDWGDIPVDNTDIEGSLGSIEKHFSEFIQTGSVPVILGGDPSITQAEIRGTGLTPALIHFGAHQTAVTEGVDTEHSIQVGPTENSVYDQENIITSVQAHDLGIDGTARAIRQKAGASQVFVTFDIDFLDPAYAPGTGTPECEGFTTWEALELIRKSLLGLDIIGFDLVNVNPSYDNDEVTCMAAARIAFEFMSIIACRKAGICSYKGFSAGM